MLRISVGFQADSIPLCFRMPILSIIKEAIRKGDPDTYTHYFESNTLRPKPYATAVYLQNFILGEPDITLTGFRLHFTTSEYSILLPLLNGLQRTSMFTYKQYAFNRGAVRFEPEQRVSSGKVIVTTLSPILIEDENGHPLAPSDPQYNDHFNEISNRLSQSLRKHPLRKVLRITPISTKKRVIKETNEAFLQARESDGQYLYFTAYSGRFLLEGDPTDIQWLLDVGVGLRRGQSFGMLALEMEVNM